MRSTLDEIEQSSTSSHHQHRELQEGLQQTIYELQLRLQQAEVSCSECVLLQLMVAVAVFALIGGQLSVGGLYQRTGIKHCIIAESCEREG